MLQWFVRWVLDIFMEGGREYGMEGGLGGLGGLGLTAPVIGMADGAVIMIDDDAFLFRRAFLAESAQGSNMRLEVVPEEGWKEREWNGVIIIFHGT